MLENEKNEPIDDLENEDSILPIDELDSNILYTESDDDVQDQDNIVLDEDVIESTEKTDEAKPLTEEEAQSKHKIKGKHSLTHDSIFKGKKKKDENGDDDEFSADFLVPKQDNFDFDVSSGYHEETKDPEEYVRLKKLKEEIYIIIIEKTDINIKNSRRKPGRLDFNKYYGVMVENLDTSTYSYGEVFIELSFYFSDNIFNMFKLLDKKWGGKIIKELAKKRNIRIDQMDFL